MVSILELDLESSLAICLVPESGSAHKAEHQNPVQP